MHLYIDANIFLDFYHLTSTDVEELRKLIALIEEGKITLYLPEQTCNEIYRNRDGKIADAMDKFKKSSSAFKLSFPAFTKSYPQYEEIREALKEANKKHAELISEANKNIAAAGLSADKLISDLIGVSKYSETSSKIFSKAIERFRKGNPPGKDRNTVGDEINWETLKSEVPESEDLYLVSDDKDYKSSLGDGLANSFLLREWKADKKGDLHFFASLTGFFKTNFPEIKLAADVKNARLIEELSTSGSFAMTHAVVGSLLKQPSFTSEQAEEMISIAELNNQVGWIVEDSDVRELYERLQKEHGENISAEAKNSLDALLAKDEEEHTAPDFEDIPF